jgi:hypothetical protein
MIKNYQEVRVGAATAVSMSTNLTYPSQKNIDRRGLPRYPVIAIAALVVGTFGSINPNAITSLGTSTWGISVKETRVVSESNIADSLRFIVDTTKISITEMARVFGVSRQAIYDWLNGGSINNKNSTAISNFDNALRALLGSGLNPSIRDLRRKIGGVSILDNLQSDAKSGEFAKVLASTLLREHSQRIKLAERFKGRERPQLKNEDFGVPHLADEA